MIEAFFLGRAPEVFLIALALSAARPLAFIMVTPIFTRFGLQAGLIRGALLLAFSAPVFINLQLELASLPALSNFEFVVILAKEFLIGLLLALVLGIPLWAVAAAGDMIDFQRGASMAELVEPGSGDVTSPTGTLFFLLIALLLASSDWFRDVLLHNLYLTYHHWPVLEPIPPLKLSAGAGVLALLDAIIRTGLILSIPIFGSMLLTEISLALAGKYIQQLNIMFLAMGVKQIVYAILLPVYFASLIYFMRGEIAELTNTIEVLKGFLNPDEVAR